MTVEAPSRRTKFLRSLLEIPIIVLVSFALVFGFVRPVIAESRYVGSGSMIPTLEVYDRVLVNKLAYDFGNDPERGDIVLFEDVDGGPDPLIKRVVGLPGDVIEVRKDTLYVNGKPQKEPYTNDRLRRRQSRFGPMKVPPNRFFMMGDNRGNSADSRVFGPVPHDNLIGEAFVRFWPLDRVGLL